MKNTQKIEKYFLIFFILLSILFLCSCQKGIFTTFGEINSINDNSSIIHFDASINIKGEIDIIKDCTPEFKIINDDKNIVSMSFSGNNKNWSEWVDFSEKYDQFNIANDQNGTLMESGNKNIYIRFRDIEGNVFPSDFQKPIFCSFYYEMQTVFSIRIEPDSAEMQPGDEQQFFARGYDLFIQNEVPLDHNKVVWSKPCATGELNPATGLYTTYTAPQESGVRNISVHYGSLSAGAKVYIKKE